MEPPEQAKKPDLSIRELHKIPSEHDRFGYAPNRVVHRNETIEIPRDFIGTNYVNENEEPNVVYLPNGTFRAVKEISTNDEILTIPYGEGFPGPSYVGALGSATYPMIPFTRSEQREPWQERTEAEKWHAAHVPKSVEKKEDLEEMVAGLENEQAFENARQANSNLINERLGLKQKFAHRRAERLYRQANTYRYPEFAAFEKFRGKQKRKPSSPFEEVFLWEEFDRQYQKPKTSVKQELNRDFQQIKAYKKQSPESLFSGPTTTLYRTLGGKRITKAEVPTAYLQELERRTNPQKGKTPAPVQRRPRQNLIFSLPKINTMGIFYPPRAQYRRLPLKKVRKR